MLYNWYNKNVLNLIPVFVASVWVIDKMSFQPHLVHVTETRVTHELLFDRIARKVWCQSEEINFPAQGRDTDIGKQI